MTTNLSQSVSPLARSKTTVTRPPIVVVVGHIDHGKSTLLDFIRKTNVVEKEAGGITQHLGAYEVTRETATGPKKITFLDTPGHESFSAIRERGAVIADLAVLMVSAEEGVKAQTIEALKAIEATGKPFIVAINKIDRPNADPERTKQSLAENNILVESYGGKVPSANISAKTGAGVDELLDLILLQAEMEELTGDPTALATGFVLEANRDAKVGVTATLIIKNGSLNVGDFVVIGPQTTKIKKLDNYLNENVKTAGLSAPVKAYGFSDIPPVGLAFQTFADKKSAEAIAAANAAKTEATEVTALDEKFRLPIVAKADVAGSLEAIKKELAKLETELAGFNLIATGLGTIGENDVKLAAGAEQAVIIGFNVKTERAALDLAQRLDIIIKTEPIIYKLSEWLAEVLEERRPKQTVEATSGEAKVLKLFSKTKNKQVLGGQVTSGSLGRGREVKILRRGNEIGRGRISDLEQTKKKTGQVAEGEQFGAVVETKLTIAPGDVLQTFELASQ